MLRTNGVKILKTTSHKLKSKIRLTCDLLATKDTVIIETS